MLDGQHENYIRTGRLSTSGNPFL